jgi:L-serine/L-threonine ammonia-lyase
VVVPQTASARAQALLRQQGAEVRVHGASWQEAHELAQALTDADAALIHPFDDPLLWHGHATLVDEVVAAGLQFDAVLLSVGGGGLLCGVAEGLRRHGLDGVPILAVETAGAASLRAAIDAGRTVELPRIDSVAVSLGAKRVCERAWQWTREREVRSIVLPDARALAACERFLDDHRILVEPACGASLAPAYEPGDALAGFGRLLVVVCGGATTTADQLHAWVARQGM